MQNNDAEYLEILAAELNVRKIVLADTLLDDAILDTKITPALQRAGDVRELIRHVNNLRKQAGLTIADRIILYWQSRDKDLQELFSTADTEIKQQVLADNIVNDNKSGLITDEVKINGKRFAIEFNKRIILSLSVWQVLSCVYYYQK